MPPPPTIRHLLRSTPTIAPVPNRGLLYLSGSQATEFVNGLLASTVPKFGTGPFFSAFIHAQGRVLHDVFVYPKKNARGHDGYLVEYDNRSSEAPPLLPTLKRYVLRSKVKIEDVTHEYDVWSVWGSDLTRSWETPRRWTFARSGAIEPAWPKDEPWPWGIEGCRLRDRRAVGMGERLLTPKGDRPKECNTHDTADSDTYTLHRIMNGVPEGITDLLPLHAFPMESNLDIMGGLDFRKGCYVGQELTVRTYHTGMIRKRILPVRLHDPVGPSEKVNTNAYGDIRAVIVDQQSVPRPRPRGSGRLLSTMRDVGLALLRLEHVEGCESGRLRFLVDSGEGESDKTQWSVSHWWPDWWPRDVE